VSEPRYSGRGSRSFWRRVGSLPDEERFKLYACGVLLQNLERSVLTWLAEAEKKAPRAAVSRPSREAK
jgi:hypothetical protein